MMSSIPSTSEYDLKSLCISEEEEDAYHRDYVTSRLAYFNNLIENLKPPQKRPAMAIIQSYQTQLSNPSYDPEGISEDSSYVTGTTLLKALPHAGIDKDEAHEILAVINQCLNDEKHIKHPDPLYFEKTYGDLMLSGVHDEESSTSTTCGPVLQLLSVRISSKTDGSICEDFETCGEISVTDDKGNIFYMYKREQDDPDLVSPDWNYLHVAGCPVAPVLWGKLKCSLTNKGRQIFDEEYDVEKLVVDDEEKSIVTCVGKYGYCACLEFNKFNYAVMARTGMFLINKQPSGELTYPVHGTITVNNIICFKRDENYPKVMRHEGDGFHQLRRVFAASIFSPWLDIEVELFSGGLKIADETIKIDCCGTSTPVGISDYPCKDEKYIFGLEEEWFCHADFFGSTMFTKELNVKWSGGVFPVVQINRRPPAKNSMESRKPSKLVNVIVEVFSIFVGGGDSYALLSLCGTIVVRDREETVYIFSRGRKCPDKLLSNEQEPGRRILSLAWSDRWVLQENFFMHLKLKDYEGNQVIRGSFTVPARNGYRHDKRMCSIIRGENGYFAAVQYSAFIDGKKARVSVKWEGHHSILVCGSIFTEYSNYDYPCTYDKEYYRSIIFNRSKEDGVKVKGHFEVPLSKSHVSAPSDCEGLIVYVKLWYGPNLGSFSEQCAIDTKLEFNASRMFATEELGSFLVKVQWE